MKRRLALGLWLWTTPEMVLAHDVQNIQSGSLLSGAQLSVWVFLGVFGILFLLSLGGLAYGWMGTQTAKRQGQKASKPKRNWIWGFGTLAALSLAIVCVSITVLSYNAQPDNRAVLYSQGWEIQGGETPDNPNALTVTAGQLNSISITSTLPQKHRVYLPELGIDEQLSKGQQVNVTFVAVDTGIYRSESIPVLTIQAN